MSNLFIELYKKMESKTPSELCKNLESKTSSDASKDLFQNFVADKMEKRFLKNTGNLHSLRVGNMVMRFQMIISSPRSEK